MNPQNTPTLTATRLTPKDAAHFENGLPGFPEEKDFLVLQDPKEAPLAWLQSVRTPNLAFIVTSPFTLFPDYRPDVPDSDLAAIGSPEMDKILVLSLLRIVPSTPPQLLVNLKAPILINLVNLASRQVILSNEATYSDETVYVVPA